jgi:hypothetical protein
LQVPATTRVHIWLLHVFRSICKDQVLTDVKEDAEMPKNTT